MEVAGPLGTPLGSGQKETPTYGPPRALPPRTHSCTAPSAHVFPVAVAFLPQSLCPGCARFPGVSGLASFALQLTHPPALAQQGCLPGVPLTPLTRSDLYLPLSMQAATPCSGQGLSDPRGVSLPHDNCFSFFLSK